MSTTLPTDEPPQEQVSASLLELQAELERQDAALHDLLMRRAELASRVAGPPLAGKPAFRPGYEAETVRRLLRGHGGALPRQTLVRIWRELLAGCMAMQGPLLVAVCETDPANGAVQCAREHFGALTPLRVHPSPAQAIADVSAGLANVAVLPMPVEGEPARAAWWVALLHRDDPRIHVVARLPFWSPRPEGAPRVQALVVTAAAPDRSAQDRSLVGFELLPEMSRARLVSALGTAGLPPTDIILRRDPAAPVAHGLITVDGFVADDDVRLSSLAAAVHAPVVLGSYAEPIAGDAA
jgi:chorismate mutase